MGAVRNGKGKRWMAVGNFPLRRGGVISPAKRKVFAPAYVAEIYTVGETTQTHTQTQTHVDCIHHHSCQQHNSYFTSQLHLLLCVATST